MLTLLIHKLKQAVDMRGTVIVVPIANPMGLNAVTHNTQEGRWNPIDGINWNRIFPVHPQWRDHREEKQFFQAQYAKESPSIQERLAAVLRLQSAGADYVVDIHATGSVNCPHIFCREDFSTIFEPLGAPIHLLSDKEAYTETFEESHVHPFRNTLSDIDIPKACTWEISAYGARDESMLEERLLQLENWLTSIWEGVYGNTTSPKKLTRFMHLICPGAGYYLWVKRPGDEVGVGETYAKVFLPWSAEVREVKAAFDFVLIAIYGIVAIADGEQLAWIGRYDG